MTSLTNSKILVSSLSKFIFLTHFTFISGRFVTFESTRNVNKILIFGGVSGQYVFVNNIPLMP